MFFFGKSKLKKKVKRLELELSDLKEMIRAKDFDLDALSYCGGGDVEPGEETDGDFVGFVGGQEVVDGGAAACSKEMMEILVDLGERVRHYKGYRDKFDRAKVEMRHLLDELAAKEERLVSYIRANGKLRRRLEHLGRLVSRLSSKLEEASRLLEAGKRSLEAQLEERKGEVCGGLRGKVERVRELTRLSVEKEDDEVGSKIDLYEAPRDLTAENGDMTVTGEVTPRLTAEKENELITNIEVRKISDLTAEKATEMTKYIEVHKTCGLIHLTAENELPMEIERKKTEMFIKETSEVENEMESLDINESIMEKAYHVLTREFGMFKIKQWTGEKEKEMDGDESECDGIDEGILGDDVSEKVEEMESKDAAVELEEVQEYMISAVPNEMVSKAVMLDERKISFDEMACCKEKLFQDVMQELGGKACEADLVDEITESVNQIISKSELADDFREENNEFESDEEELVDKLIETFNDVESTRYLDSELSGEFSDLESQPKLDDSDADLVCKLREQLDDTESDRDTLIEELNEFGRKSDDQLAREFDETVSIFDIVDEDSYETLSDEETVDELIEYSTQSDEEMVDELIGDSDEIESNREIVDE